MSSPRLDAHMVVRRNSEFTLDVRLGIAPGTTAALLGPNGAGKSTSDLPDASSLSLTGCLHSGGAL